jgi:hypothetical protein
VQKIITTYKYLPKTAKPMCNFTFPNRPFKNI